MVPLNSESDDDTEASPSRQLGATDSFDFGLSGSMAEIASPGGGYGGDTSDSFPDLG
jgi:hypothetical protein